MNINPTNVKDCVGFHWPETANQNQGGNVWVFKDNKTFDDRCHGIFVWQNDSDLHIIDGSRGPGIDHGAYGNHYIYGNVTVGYLEVHAIGWSTRDSSVGDAVTKKHAAAAPLTVCHVERLDSPDSEWCRQPHRRRVLLGLLSSGKRSVSPVAQCGNQVFANQDSV